MSLPHSLNILWSYAYLKSANSYRIIDVLTSCSNVLIDSGAFTAYQTGKEITIDQYIEACKRYFHGRVWQYIMLDKIKNPAGTRMHLKKMYEAGLTPMPVWVVGMEESEVKDLVAYNPHICVAGGVGSGDDFAHYRYQAAFRASEKTAKIHSLGFLRWPDVFRLPLFSGDSSTYSNGSRWGVFARFSPQKGVECLRIDNITKDPVFLQWMKKCDVPDEVIYGAKMNTGGDSFLTFNTVFAHIKYSQFCLAKGFRYFWAIPDAAWLNRLAATIYAYQGDHFNFVQCLRMYYHLRDLMQNDFDSYLTTTKDILRKY